MTARVYNQDSNGVLPPDARRILMDAARFKGNDLEKAKKIDEATQRVKRLYPQFFK